MSTELYVHRTLKHYTVADLSELLEQEISIANWSTVSVRSKDEKYFYDIGRLMYTKRLFGKGHVGIGGSTNKVLRSSRYAKRKFFVSRLAEWICDSLGSSSDLKRRSTLGKKLTDINRFVGWCDENIEPHCLSCIESGRSAFQHYYAFLDHSVKVEDIGQTTASTYQKNTSEILCYVYDLDHYGELTKGRALIQEAPQHSYRADKLIDSVSFGESLGICLDLFYALSEFLINEKPYPHKINVSGLDFWMMPTNRWVLSEINKKKRSTLGNPCWYWDYENGKVHTRNKILELNGLDPKTCSGSQKNTAQGYRYTALSAIRKANSGKFSFHRYQVVQLAVHCYLFIFLCATGMNLEQAVSISNLKNEFSRRNRKFRSTKARAGGVEVEYHLGTKVFAIHKKYLSLREMYLELDPEFDLLFFTASKNGSLKRLQNDPFASLFNRLNNMFGFELQTITSRQTRATKANVLVNEHGVKIAAMMLQNQESTIERSYSNGSDIQLIEDIPTFYDDLESAIGITVRRNSAKEMESGVGCCRSHGAPKSIHNVSLIPPDCKSLFGCFYCRHYATTTTEEDIRKLCSTLYFIGELKKFRLTASEYNDMYSDLVGRIEFILGKITSRSSKLKKTVSIVRAEVFEQEMLSEYWQRQINDFSKLGIIA